jgi:hypothetical protein
MALILPGTDFKASALNGSRVGGLTALMLVRAESGRVAVSDLMMPLVRAQRLGDVQEVTSSGQ